MAVTLLRQKAVLETALGNDRIAVVISNTGGRRGHTASFQTYIIEADGQLWLEESASYYSDPDAIKAFDDYVAEFGGAA